MRFPVAEQVACQIPGGGIAGEFAAPRTAAALTREYPEVGRDMCNSKAVAWRLTRMFAVLVFVDAVAHQRLPWHEGACAPSKDCQFWF